MKLKLVQPVRWAKVEPEDGDGPPSGATDDDLSLINSFSEVIVPRTRKNVFVRRAFAIHDGPMHGNRLQLATQTVRELAAAAPHVKVQANHKLDLPYGFIFRGGVAPMDGLNYGVFDVAYPRSPVNEEVVLRLDGGAISEWSVQLFFDHVQCSLCGKPHKECKHVAGEGGCRAVVVGLEEFVELSMVYAGRVPNTRSAIAASRDADFGPLDALLAKAPADPLAGLFAKKESTEAEASPMSHLFAR